MTHLSPVQHWFIKTQNAHLYTNWVARCCIKLNGVNQNGESNGRGSAVNRALDDSAYPSLKQVSSSLCKQI